MKPKRRQHAHQDPSDGIRTPSQSSGKAFYDVLLTHSQAIAYRFVSCSDGSGWQVEYLSPQFEKILGISTARFINQPVTRLWAVLRGLKADKEIAEETLVWENPHRGEMAYEMWDASGGKHYWEESFQYLRRKKGAEHRMHGIWFDITERIRAGLNYQYLKLSATPLLTSRTFFLDRLHQAMALARRQNESFAVICADLDRLGRVNQSFGYEYGDMIIREMAQRLSETLYETDSILPLGGDSFMILIPRVTKQQTVEAIANKILLAFKKPFHVADQDIVMSCSLGIAAFPFDGETALDLMQHAYQVMRTARKKGGAQYHFYSSQEGKNVLDDLIVEAQLRNAIRKNQLRLHYQPQIDLKNGKIIGVEALVRWEHPELGMIPPLKFIPIAEETGLIHSIGEWVLRTACMQRREWEQCGIRWLRMAVNLSAKQFHHESLVELIKRMIAETQINPEELELEITESTLMQYTGEVTETLKSLKQLGVRFSIDDFGTGYSSLVALKQLPLNTLKIDRSFVRDLCTDMDDQAITQAIISMAHDLKLDVVAEGIESREQMDFLKSRLCDKGQGYLFAKPLPSDFILPLLLASHSEAA